MAFTGRTRAAIRSALLSDWAAQYAARGETLLVAPGSDAYLEASALATQLEALEAAAEQVTKDMLPDQASSEALDRHAYVDGLTRQAGFTARASVTVSAASNTTFTISAGTRMAYSDGTLYVVESASVTTSGGGHTGTINVRAVEAGAIATRATGDTLTFVTAPTGLNSTGTVASSLREGTDAESDAELAQRIIARRRERPGSGNRADWREWVMSYTATEIADAYVYPLLAPPASFPGAGTADTPGCVTVVAIGPAQGDSTTNTRIVPVDDVTPGTPPGGEELPHIEDYIEGDRLPDGTDVSATPNDALRPVVVTPGNYCVQQISVSSQAVLLTVTVSATNAPQWSGTMLVGSVTSTTLTVTGNQLTKVGYRALIAIGTNRYRGSFKVFTFGAGSFDGVNTTFAMDDSDIQYASGFIYPAVLNFAEIREAVLDYFDALGPGDTTPASRWPSEDDGARATLYRTALAAAAIGVDGVLSATTTTPASDVTPAVKTVVTLDTFRVTT